MSGYLGLDSSKHRCAGQVRIAYNAVSRIALLYRARCNPKTRRVRQVSSKTSCASMESLTTMLFLNFSTEHFRLHCRGATKDISPTKARAFERQEERVCMFEKRAVFLSKARSFPVEKRAVFLSTSVRFSEVPETFSACESSFCLVFH